MTPVHGEIKRERVMYQDIYNEIYHHGIKGMKWGVRRFQNPDGSLTAAGRERYGKMNPDKLNQQLSKKVAEQKNKLYGKTGHVEYNKGIGKNSNNLIEEERKKIDEITTKWGKEFDRRGFDFDDPDLDISDILNSMDKEINNNTATQYSQHSNAKWEKYSKDALKNIGKLNVAYLQDLGYDKESAEYLDTLLRKSKNRAIY